MSAIRLKGPGVIERFPPVDKHLQHVYVGLYRNSLVDFCSGAAEGV